MEIQEIKARLSIHTVLSHYGLHPDRNNMLKCPFHADATASLKIYPNTNTFNCFGCSKNGDQIEFCTFKEGSKHKGLLMATELSGNIKSINNKPIEANYKPKENHTAILTHIFESFKSGLHHPISVKPKEYLKSRNLNPELLEVGYNSGQFHYRGKLSEANHKACVEAGLLIPYTGSVPNASGISYTAFAKECIIFALKDKEENIVSLYGRSIIDNKNAKHYYTVGRQGLYPGYPNPNTTTLILTEAIIDAATLLQLFPFGGDIEGTCVLACFGTNGLTEEHRAAIKELPNLQEIVFFFDGDKAATEAIKKHQEELLNELPNIKLSAVQTPENEDINSLSIAYDIDIFSHLLYSRKPFLLTKNGSIEIEGETDVKTRHALSQEVESQSLLAPSPLERAGVRPFTDENPLNTPLERATTKPCFNARNPDYITFTTDELQIIILGGINLQQLDRLRITVKISRTNTGDPLHSIRHTLDLYHSDYLEKFIGKACEQLEMGTNVLKRAIAEFTEQIEAYRLSKIESLKEEKPQARQLSEQRHKRAANYLKAPNLMERTNHDIGRTGMIGEENNRLLMYLVFTSRLREQPLHIISLGASGTGKTYLQEKVSELIPEQDKLEITILSENAFYYFERKELKHKLVLIEDMDGAENVLYPLRELQSKKKISKTIPIKDSKGNMKTITLKVEGPISLAGTTTKERLYEDNANRSLLVYLDNSHEHKELIMEYQRKLSAGKVNDKEENELKEFFKDMQCVLKPVKVRNPYAELLKLPESVFKPLRTNSHYLAVIETITFYHQYQRELQIDSATGEHYIETTLEDIEWANKLLKEVLLAKADELNQAERSFFESLKKWLAANNKSNFYAKEIREAFRMHPSMIKRYLYTLSTYNLIRITGGNRFKAGFEYDVIATNEYKNLESTVTSVLDTVLEDIRRKTSGSVAHRWVMDKIDHSTISESVS